MVDEDEGGEDDPVELVDQAQIRSSILHEAVVGIEDEEKTETNIEEHGIHVHISRGEPSLGGKMKGWADGIKNQSLVAQECTWMSTPQTKSRLPESSTARASQLLARKAIGLQTAEKEYIQNWICNTRT